MSSQYNDTDDDLPLHTRGSREDTYPREMHADVPEREVTLNTGVVLGIFFALAVLCAVFFGFGYSIGHKSAPAPIAVADPVTTTTDDGTSATVATKPAAAQPVVPQYVPSPGVKLAKPSAAETLPAEKAVASTETKPKPAAHTAPPVRVEAAPAPAPLPVPAAGTGTLYVQVAAVSHQEDADVLEKALKRRGYAVHVRNDASDHLLHVQVGPFPTRKDADAIRQRLAGDGYNGYIK